MRAPLRKGNQRGEISRDSLRWVSVAESGMRAPPTQAEEAWAYALSGVRYSGAAHERRREGVGAKRVGRKRAYVIDSRKE